MHGVRNLVVRRSLERNQVAKKKARRFRWASALLGLFRAVGRDLVDQAFHARVRCIHLRLDLLGLTLGFFHGLVPFMCPARLADRGSANEAKLSRCGISPSKAMKKALARDRGFQIASLLSDALLQQRGIA